MKALIFGSTGQVASELRHLLPDGRFLSRLDADLASPEECERQIAESPVHVVINAAAWTAVDQAESSEAEALVINGKAPEAMARAAAQKNIPFLHVSTDYVFDGSGRHAWMPDAATNPLNAYGRTKLAGETAIRSTGGQHLILRTSWVFSEHGNNFVKTMLRLSETRDRLSVVTDQVGGPTPASGIAEALVTLAKIMITDRSAGGTHHYAGTPDISWAGFAREIFRQMRRPMAVEHITTAQWPTPAPRPLNSRLDCSSLERFGIQRPDWRISLAQCLTRMDVKQ